MLERIVLKKNAVFVSVGKDCLHRQFFKEHADFRPARVLIYDNSYE